MAQAPATGQWIAGAEPWLRRVAPADAPGEFPPPVADGPQCYFCGATTIKRGWADINADAGRIDIYCDNPRCDAREITVLVRRDGRFAAHRADVRVLAWIDRGGIGDAGMSGELITYRPQDRNPAEVLARRTSRDIVSVDVP